MIKLENNNKIPSDLQNCINKLPLAMAYVPLQQFGEMYSPAVALERGTLFPELDLPFEGETVKEKGRT